MYSSSREPSCRETQHQHILTQSLIRSLLPDEWDCRQENGNRIQSDGLYLRSSPCTNNDGDGGMSLIRSNQWIKLSSIIPCLRSERLLDQSSSETSGSGADSHLDFVYYFEVFFIAGDFSVGFDADGEPARSIAIGGGLGMVPASIGLHVGGDLYVAGVRISNWTQPFQNGDTIGCGVVIGTNPNYFFTRNGVKISSGNADCHVSSMHTTLIPCVGVSSTTVTVLRTNFGCQSDHRFLWKGSSNVRIISHATPRSSVLPDVSNHSSDILLPTGLIRGHTISGDTRVDPLVAVCTEEEKAEPSTPRHSGEPTRRRHSELLPLSNYPLPSEDFDSDSGNDGHVPSITPEYDPPRRAEPARRRHSELLPLSDYPLPSEDFDLDSGNDGHVLSIKSEYDPPSKFFGDAISLDLDDIQEMARELRSATSASDADHGALSQLIDVCRSNLEQLNEIVQRATMGVDCEHDLGELLSVHELVTDAIQAAEMKSTKSDKKPSSEDHDIFSLLCHLRGQQQKRRDAVWGLLGLTKRGCGERCHEIITSGGMQSLLTLFKTSLESTELMMVSALTVVYLLPSLLDSDEQSSSYIHLGVIGCLRFLIQSSRENSDINISPSEIRTASAFTMTNLWFKVLVPKLRSTEDLANNSITQFRPSGRGGDSFSNRRFLLRRRSSLSSQPGEEVDCSTLIDSFTSLSVMAAESEASRQDEKKVMQANDMNVYYEFALIVESICAVEYARPLAMKGMVIKLLLRWLRSGDVELERPASNALRNLTLSQDDYTAGWVHSQLLNDNALVHIVGRLESGDSRVRLAMAEVISRLTVASHTRAGIISARGVKYLVQLLGSVDIQKDEALALAVGTALLNMVAGAACSGGEAMAFIFPTHVECTFDEIIQTGLLNTLVSMASLPGNYGSLRFMSVKLIKVISEGCSADKKVGGKERDLCKAGAVTALGTILSSDTSFIRSSIENSLASSENSDLINDSLSNDVLTSAMAGSSENMINEIQYVLRGLASILRWSSSSEGDCNTMSFSETQLGSCSQLIASGGVKSLIWISSMTQDACAELEMTIQGPRFCWSDIQIDSSITLAFLCPLITISPQIPGRLKWAWRVLLALINFLKNEMLANGNSLVSIHDDVHVNVLQGLACLADCEPLKTRIIDEFMPHLLLTLRNKNCNLSDAATQVCLALGFNEVESGANDAYLLCDKFNLTRSFLLQALVRDEIRLLLKQIWMPAIRVAKEQLCEDDDTEQSHEMNNELGSLFHSLCQDEDTLPSRKKFQQQFMDLYGCHPVPSSHRAQSLSTIGQKSMKRTMHRSGSYTADEEAEIVNQISNSGGTSTNLREETNLHDLSSELAGDDFGTIAKSCVNNFLQCHQYPLNGTAQERDWVMGHCQALAEDASLSAPFLPHSQGREDLLRVCFPSVLIRDQVIPLFCFRPDASFNFRALAMPSGRYYSFRREGQLLLKELENIHLSDQVHCSLCFHNSSYAGEFTESLLQALYLCPIIQGISFSNDVTYEDHACGGSELLPFLAKAIPSSLTHLTFDNCLSNSAALALSHVLKNVYDDDGDEDTVASTSVKGSLHALAITNSPHIDQTVFDSLVESVAGLSSPLQFLRVLDLSGNLLGDSGSAQVLSIALSPSSSISIEQLDLSRNDIREGNAVKGVLQHCMSYDPKLEVLRMSGNKFGEGEVASQLAASLGDVLANLISIDLSGNDLSGAFLITLGGCLISDCQLVNLNLTNNQFSSSSINGFLSKLLNISKSNVSTQLSFVQLRGNSPSLASSQKMVLNDILEKNRQRHAVAYIKKQRAVFALQRESDSENNDLSSLSDLTGGKLPPSQMITFLFSAPLVWKDGDNQLHPIEMLDFKREKFLVWQCFSEASRNIDLMFDNATTDRLQAVMTRGHKCLHFSGHGHPYCLTFEDGSGGIHWFSIDQLKALISGGIEDGEPPFQFVFVSACHSSLAGHTFVDCGVPHVVCCQQESQLMDRAALSFTRGFYLALAVGRTVKDSFEIGKHAVLSSATVPSPDIEMEKFMLLPEDGYHDVKIFNAIEVPEWPLASSKLDVNASLPTPPQGFLGRETDMYHTLNLVLNRRFVNIVGPTGMGRFSLASALCHYIDDRKSTLLFDDIHFANSRSRGSLLKRVGKASPITLLHNQLVSAGRAHTMPNSADLDEIIQDILASLKQTKSLLVFDKIDMLDPSTAQDFHFFLGRIFEQTKDVHVLVTSNKSIGSLVSVGESVHNLEPLNFRNTVKIFAFHCPHLHSSRERKAFVEQLASHTVMNNSGENDAAVEQIKLKLGGGIPAKIFAGAYEMTAADFEELKRISTNEENAE